MQISTLNGKLRTGRAAEEVGAGTVPAALTRWPQQQHATMMAHEHVISGGTESIEILAAIAAPRANAPLREWVMYTVC